MHHTSEIHEHEYANHHHDNDNPMEEVIALLEYMIKHNNDHAEELIELGKKVEINGMVKEAKKITEAISVFKEGNSKLAEAFKLIKGE